MGIRSREQGGRAPLPLVFSYMVQNICSTDIVDRGLIVLFLSLFCYFLIFIQMWAPGSSDVGGPYKEMGRL